MRVSVAAGCLSLCLFGFALSEDAYASIRMETNIPAEGLAPALRALAADRNIRVLYVTKEVATVRTEGAIGDFTTEEALKRLLSGTGLTYRYVDDATITIETAILREEHRGRVSKTALSNTSDNPNTDHEGETSPSGQIRDAAGDRETTSQSSTAAINTVSTGETSQRANLDEIIVTAQKRNERLQDVPVPVTALSADSLVEQNLMRVQDYYTRIPGVNYSTTGNNNSEALLSIRGLTTQGGNPTVGIVVDDVPYGSSSSYAGGGAVPDIDPGDLVRIEVLRGPQGTLYGASSLGGLIKFVTIDPATDAMSGRVQVGTSSVYNGAELGYNMRGSINLPLSNTLAIRASGFTREDPGYIDNVSDGQRGVNEARISGGRLAALWQMSENLSLKLSALVQQTKTNGSSNVEVGVPGVGDLQQNELIDSGWHNRNIQSYNATISVKVGSIDLTAISGYGVTKYRDSLDFSALLAPYTLMQFGVTGSPILDRIDTNKFTQEIRLSSAIGSKLDWLAGVFYTHESSTDRQNIPAVDSNTGTVVGEWFYDYFPTTYAEYAAFADLTFHITDKFDVQVGGRESANRQTYYEIDAGLYIPFFIGVPSPLITSTENTNDNSFTYLLTPRFRISSDLMLYARLATGYRPGGPNPTASAFDLPTHFGPDKTQNYEIGVKGDTLNHVFSFDASVYYIDWKNIQLSLFQPGSSAAYFANASRAKSEGVELAAESRPTSGMRISAWVAWNEAVLTEPFPSISQAYGQPGDRLPDSARYSGNFSIDQDFFLTDSMMGFVGGAESYVGDRVGFFTGSAVRQIYPAYAQTDLHGGVRYNSWTASIFATNVTDKRGLVGGGIGSPVNSAAFNIIQPRTVGLNIAKTF